MIPDNSQTFTAQATRSFPLDGREIKIGRDATCDICLSGVGVSRRHAAVSCDYPPRIVDTGSAHGTRLNGNPVTEALLLSGATLTVGVHVLKVYIDDGYISFTLLNFGADSDEFGADANVIVRIGRDVTNDICLPHPMVSRFHAIVKHAQNGRLVIVDNGSANSTYVNGSAVGTASLNEGDVIHIGPFRFFVTDGKFCRVSGTETVNKINKIKIEAHGLSVRLKKKRLLENVNLTVDPGAFVALLGPSGAGKSTLSKVLSGQMSPTSGRLFMNGFPAAKFGAAFARGIGYVSQQILLRPELTVWETLTDQSLIRLPGDSTEKERRGRAEEVLELMGLTRPRDRRVADLSGGEARRLHVGVELLASPAVIILDEPLAGLDPGLIVKFMKLFRRICDKGHTLILITHTLEQIELCDRVVYIEAGHTLFSGAPGEICSRFNVSNIARIYELGGDGGQNGSVLSPEPAAETLPSTRHIPAHGQRPPHNASGLGAAFRHPVSSILFFARQTFALTARYSKVYLRDRRNMILLLAQTPLITLLLGFVYKASILQFPMSFYFCLTVTGIWVGGLDAVREVAAELPLLAREAKCGMNRVSYITARIAAAVALSAVQASLFIVSAVVVFRNLDFSAELFILLFTAIIAGNILGFAVSACSGGVGRAISALPIVLIPQIFFSGILVQFEYMEEIGRQISYLTVSRPVFGIMKRVFLLERSLFWHYEWTELFLLCAALITIFWVALKSRTGRGNAT